MLGVNSPLPCTLDAEVVAWVGVVKVRACKGELGVLLNISMVLRGVRDDFDRKAVDRDSASICAFLCDSEVNSCATVLGVADVDVAGFRPIDFFFGEAEREVDLEWVTVVASLEELALPKE